MRAVLVVLRKKREKQLKNAIKRLVCVAAIGASGMACAQSQDRLPDEPTRELARTVLRLSGQQQEMLSSGKLDDDARDVLKRLQEARQQLAQQIGVVPSQRVALAAAEERAMTAVGGLLGGVGHIWRIV